MKKELVYIVQGFLMFIAFAIAIWFFNILFSIKPPSSSITGNMQPAKAPVVINSAGEKLFKNNCAACHAIHKHITGPALAGIEERVTDKKLLYEWIRNNQAVLQSGNDYFTSLYNQYNKISMNVFPYLSDAEIDAILEYIQQESDQKALPSYSLVVKI